jgi:hypothetical protein
LGNGGKWSVSCPGRFTPSERAPGIVYEGGWVRAIAVRTVGSARVVPSIGVSVRRWHLVVNVGTENYGCAEKNCDWYGGTQVASGGGGRY